MSDGERSAFQPNYLTIPEVWELYQQKEQPLNADAIRVALEPLAGTSFLPHATEILRLTKHGEPIHALDLYLIFYGAFDDTFKSTDDQQQEQASICLYHLAGFSVPLDSVYTMRWMEPDELLAQEYRSDFLYHDPDQTRYAGTHRTIQFRFYKAGTHRHTLTVSQVEYQDAARLFHVYTQLAEGHKPHRFFGAVEQPPVPFVDPRHMSFYRTHPLVFISPQFSVERARPPAP